MKKLLFILALSSTVASAQWVQKTSCKKDAAKITNEAIESDSGALVLSCGK